MTLTVNPDLLTIGENADFNPDRISIILTALDGMTIAEAQLFLKGVAESLLTMRIKCSPETPASNAAKILQHFYDNSAPSTEDGGESRC